MRSVLITGATKGIGRATALYLDARGWRVYAGYRQPADADRLRHDASERLTPVHIDVSDRELIRAAARQIEQADRGGLDALVNNAGIVAAGPLEILPLDEFRYQLEVNATGQLAVTQAMLPLVRKRQGRIVMVSSINGRIASPFNGAYAASKFALEAISDALRNELRYWGIRVIVIQPGAIRTPIWETSKTRARHTFAQLPPRAAELYGTMLTRLVERSRVPPRAIAPEHVARAIHRALTVRRPRTRYLVGWDAKIAALVRWIVPDKAMDRLLTR